MKFLVALLLVVCMAGVNAQGYGAKPGGKPELTLKQLQQIGTEYKAAKAALSKNPKDAKAKKRFVAAGVKFGHESMMSSVLDRKLKYKQALTVYREVLKVDPKNPVAKQESELIINIYKSLGRPVPK